jgi:hypothetical protein
MSAWRWPSHPRGKQLSTLADILAEPTKPDTSHLQLLAAAAPAVLLAAGITRDTQIEVRHPGAEHLAVRAKVAARPSSASWRARDRLLSASIYRLVPTGKRKRRGPWSTYGEDILDEAA